MDQAEQTGSTHRHMCELVVGVGQAELSCMRAREDAGHDQGRLWHMVVCIKARAGGGPGGVFWGHPD